VVEGGALLNAQWPGGQRPTPDVVIVRDHPGVHEAEYIGSTLECLAVASRPVKEAGAEVEVVVVDNASTDLTAAIATAAGARSVRVLEHNISKVRHAGAAVAGHEVLVFLDADTLVPPALLARISRTMADPTYAGGAVDMLYRPCRLVLRAYLGFWRALGLLGGMAQGACQFCRRDVFQTPRGYDESQYMSEDVDFHWLLRRLARRRGWTTSYVRELQVMPSPRRFDRWPLWRTLVWTNPLVAFAFRRRRGAWSGWYIHPPR
jgi:glycosyltransferase involved in cell wall biosynthesis